MTPSSKEFLGTPEGRAQLKANNLRYARSAHGQATRKAWRRDNADKVKAASKRYSTSAHGKAKKQKTRRVWRLSPRQRFNDYRVQCAQSRGLGFYLTFEQFMTFWQRPCAYCGDAIATIGLDRIDNGACYGVANLRACCTRCNQMKRDDTVEAFLRRCQKIVAHFK